MTQQEQELEHAKGDWSKHDNKRYIGKIDRVNVSLSESWEVEYFIDHYLQTRGRAVSNANRDKVVHALENFTGRAPYKRDELNAYLDKLWGLSPKV
jgi:hypothetical protein